ncbi:hypothetical protein ABZS29_23285 [Kribbella sp. NPDC005582]
MQPVLVVRKLISQVQVVRWPVSRVRPIPKRAVCWLVSRTQLIHELAAH